MPTQNASLPSLIAQAHDEQWEELDLSGMELSGLPLEIGRLTGLKRLILGRWDGMKRKWIGNSFTEIPEIIFKLTQLEELIIPVRGCLKSQRRYQFMPTF